MTKIEIISTETIKPSSPTPHHLRTFKISLLDQLNPPVFSKLVYFYLPPATDQVSLSSDNAAKLQLLKTSLSETLTDFYPFAGRIKGNFSIDCNDDGAVFVQARVRRRLPDVLNKPSDDVVKQFLALDQSKETDFGHPLFSVQVTCFECGGMAIGLLFFHKMADAAGMAAFVAAWTAAARGPGETVNPPEILTGPSLFPPKDFLAHFKLPSVSSENITRKRFVFSPSGIAALKSKSTTVGQQKPPTRVESVSALIWKCATKASRSNSETPKSSFLFQNVNLRTRFDPPLPVNSTGNVYGYYPTEAHEEETEIDLGDTVEKLRTGLIEFCNGFVKRIQEKDPSPAILERTKLYERKGADTFTVTSWCRFPALQNADFGWGKPMWVTTSYLPFKNIIVLLDTIDGDGIEAWVCLRDEDMKVFEGDQELLSYASSADPPVLTRVLLFDET